MKLSFLFIGLMMLGCNPQEEAAHKQERKQLEDSNPLQVVGAKHFNYETCSEVITFRDTQKGVTCYALMGCDGRGAISCLKME